MVTEIATGTEWASGNNVLGQFVYRTHSEAEFNDWGRRYMLPGCRPEQTASLCGFGKMGLTSQAHAENLFWMPQVTSAWKSNTGCGSIAGSSSGSSAAADAPASSSSSPCTMRVSLSFAEEAMTKYGAPHSANVTFTVAAAGNIGVDVQYQKRPTMMAESLWFSFRPVLPDPHGWRLNKLGRDVDPFDVVVNGSRSMHAVWDGVSYSTNVTRKAREQARSQLHKAASSAAHRTPAEAVSLPEPDFKVDSLDVPIVSMDTQSPIVFFKDEQIQGDSVHFNLFNNAWSVNYPEWEVNTGERFRFALKFAGAAKQGHVQEE